MNSYESVVALSAYFHFDVIFVLNIIFDSRNLLAIEFSYRIQGVFVTIEFNFDYNLFFAVCFVSSGNTGTSCAFNFEVFKEIDHFINLGELR